MFKTIIFLSVPRIHAAYGFSEYNEVMAARQLC